VAPPSLPLGTPSSVADGMGPDYSMDLPQSACGRIIGKGGATIQGMRERSGAEIKIDKDAPEGMPRTVTIIGAPHAIAAAKQMIDELLIAEFGSLDAAKGLTPATPGSLGMMGGQLPGATITENVPIEKRMVGRIIGRGGAQIRQLTNDSGAKIQIDQNVPGDAPRLVAISGTQAEIDKAKTMINELIATDTGPPGGAAGGPAPMQGGIGAMAVPMLMPQGGMPYGYGGMPQGGMPYGGGMPAPPVVPNQR